MKNNVAKDDEKVVQTREEVRKIKAKVLNAMYAYFSETVYVCIFVRKEVYGRAILSNMKNYA